MKTSSSVVFLMKKAVEVIKATEVVEAVEVIEATEVPKGQGNHSICKVKGVILNKND
jgi:hypothetical protein